MAYKEFKILKSHGLQYIPNLYKPVLTELFRGRPLISPDITADEASQLKELCPTGAIHATPCFTIDLGKCVFCKECEFAMPHKVKFTNDYRLATNNINQLQITSDIKSITVEPDVIRHEIKTIFGRALKLRQVSAAGDNSNEMELNAAGNVNFDMGRYGIEFLASPRHCDGIVITGPISANMAEPLQICYDAVPSPKIIILAGTDAISGGIFSQNEAINRNFLQNYNIDLYVPGNPVHPLTFIHGILDLTRKINKL